MSRWASRSMFAAREARLGVSPEYLARRHYDRPHEAITPRCPECAAVVETFTLTLSAYWQPPVNVERLFRRGAPTGFMRPLHGD